MFFPIEVFVSLHLYKETCNSFLKSDFREMYVRDALLTFLHACVDQSNKITRKVEIHDQTAPLD